MYLLNLFIRNIANGEQTVPTSALHTPDRLAALKQESANATLKG
jgi:hypothetical protein